MNAHIRATMPRRKTMAAIVGLLIAAASAHANHGALPDGVTPIEATWLWGHYIVPDTITKDGAPYVFAYPHKDSARIIDPPWTEVASEHIKSGAKAPAALFLHGCSGMIRPAARLRLWVVNESRARARPGPAIGAVSLIHRDSRPTR